MSTTHTYINKFTLSYALHSFLINKQFANVTHMYKCFEHITLQYLNDLIYINNTIFLVENLMFFNMHALPLNISDLTFIIRA